MTAPIVIDGEIAQPDPRRVMSCPSCRRRRVVEGSTWRICAGDPITGTTHAAKRMVDITGREL